MNKNKYHAIDAADTAAAEDGTDTTAEDGTEVDTDDNTDVDTDDTDAAKAATDDTTTTGTIYDTINNEYMIKLEHGDDYIYQLILIEFEVIVEECYDIKSEMRCKNVKRKNKCNEQKNIEQCAKTCGHCLAGNINVIQSHNLLALSL